MTFYTISFSCVNLASFRNIFKWYRRSIISLNVSKCIKIYIYIYLFIYTFLIYYISILPQIASRKPSHHLSFNFAPPSSCFAPSFFSTGAQSSTAFLSKIASKSPPSHTNPFNSAIVIPPETARSSTGLTRLT